MAIISTSKNKFNICCNQGCLTKPLIQNQQKKNNGQLSISIEHRNCKEPEALKNWNHNKKREQLSNILMNWLHSKVSQDKLKNSRMLSIMSTLSKRAKKPKKNRKEKSFKSTSSERKFKSKIRRSSRKLSTINTSQNKR